MAFPASRFTPASSPLELRIPAQLAAGTGQPEPPPPAPGPLPVPSLPVEALPPPGNAGGAGQPAVEVDRVVPASGNVWIGGQQVWLGPALSGRHITVWVDAVSLHVLLDGARIKTLPSRVVIDGETAAVVPRTTTSEVHRYKANATDKRTSTRKDSDPHA
jgi:hypothetical protein